jgi:hypothetical protein
LLWVALGAALMTVFVAAVTWGVYARLGQSLPWPGAEAPLETATPDATASLTLEPPNTVPPPTNASATPTATRPGLIARSLLPLVHKAITPVPTPTIEPSATIKPTKKPTSTPKPTPTPTLPWPDAVAAPGPSKLGLHVQWNNSPDIMEYVRRIKPRVVKTVGDFGFLEELKEASPSTIVVGRFQATDEGHGYRMEGDPAAAARAFVAERLASYRANPLVDYWEGLNEPGVNPQNIAWFAAWEAERVRAMAAHGLRCAVGSFSTGVPEWEDFEAFLPAIRAAKQHGGVLSLHEYDAPTMQRAVGAGLPGQPSYADRGALALRYRWWYEDYLKPRNLVIPLIITEAGVDGMVSNRPGPSGKGWQNFRSYWQQQGLGSDPNYIYLEQLAWYDAELRRDDYVLGCTLFTAGPMNRDWQSYDVGPVLRHLAHYAVKQ